MTIEEQPQSRTDKIKGIARRALINRGINTVIGIGVGFATGRFAFIHDNPTIYNPQISLEGKDQKPISLTLQEVAEAAQRVDDLGGVINEFVIEPDIGFNSSSIWSQDKAHIARLLGSAGLGGPSASWLFHDKHKILFDLEVDNTYKDDNRLVQSIVSAKFSLPFLATRGLLDVVGLELPERVEVVEHPTNTLPIARGILIEGGGRIPPDPEKLRKVADRFVKLPDYVKWGNLQAYKTGEDPQLKPRWALKAAGKSAERLIEFTIWDTTGYRLKIIEQTDDFRKREALTGAYIAFDEGRGVYYVSPYPVIQEGQLRLFEPLEKLGRGARIERNMKSKDRSDVEFLHPPVRIQAQYVAEVFGGALASDTGPNTEIFTNQIYLKDGRNKHFGGLHYVLMDKYGRFVDLQGNLLPRNERPYYLSKSEFQFVPATS